MTTVLTGGSSSRESCLVTNLSPPSIQSIKGYSSHEIFVVVFNCDKPCMYIKRNPNLQLMCWQEDPVPASLVTNLSPPSIKGDSSHEIFEFFQFVPLPLLRYLKRLIVDLGYKYRNCISQNKIIKFLIPLRRFFSKVNKWFMARVHLQTLQLQNTNVHLKLLLLLVRQGCSWKL